MRSRSFGIGPGRRHGELVTRSLAVVSPAVHAPARSRGQRPVGWWGFQGDAVADFYGFGLVLRLIVVVRHAPVNILDEIEQAMSYKRD